KPRSRGERGRESIPPQTHLPRPPTGGVLPAYGTWDRSHNMMVLLLLTEAKSLPSGLNARGPEPLRKARTFPLVTSHNLIPSLPPEARVFPSANGPGSCRLPPFYHGFVRQPNARVRSQQPPQASTSVCAHESRVAAVQQRTRCGSIKADLAWRS